MPTARAAKGQVDRGSSASRVALRTRPRATPDTTPGNTPRDGLGRLATQIERLHQQARQQALRAVNAGLSLRNWLIGQHIHQFEQHGRGRARYGEQLIERLAERLRESGLARMEARELRRYRSFYLSYPQIRETVSPEWLQPAAVTAADGIRETPSPESSATGVPPTPGPLLLSHLSFSHFAELLQLDDALQRQFYEIEAIKGQWSVRELQRQIATQYYQRSGLSRRRKALSDSTQQQAAARTRLSPGADIIRDPYVFEFLGLKPQEAVTESQLEQALLARLQDFLLELGHGFCFEARQKRLTIGGEPFFVDLVFYHRILKCHVLIELKNDAFRHEHLGQLNACVSWYREHLMAEGDQPPIGILLCTAKNHELVEFALAGMNNRLFVSRYQVQLPDKARMTAFLQKALRELDGRAAPRQPRTGARKTQAKA